MPRMMILGWVWISVGLVCGSFWLPWVHIRWNELALLKEIEEATGVQGIVGGLSKRVDRVVMKIRQGTQELVGDLPSLKELPRELSGADVPRISNQDQMKIVVVLIETFTGQQQHLQLKSYAVYLLPLLAILVGILFSALGAQRLVALGLAGIGALVAGLGAWKLLTLPTQTPLASVTIGHGLWLSLGGYLSFALAALATCFTPDFAIAKSGPQVPAD